MRGKKADAKTDFLHPTKGMSTQITPHRNSENNRQKNEKLDLIVAQAKTFTNQESRPLH